MGLRTASVRRPYVEVMAPALTETAQSQTFKLPPKDHLQPASPINAFETNAKYLPDVRGAYRKRADNTDDGDVPETETSLIADRCSSEFDGASGNNCDSNIIMSDSPTSMGDQTEKMGLQKAGMDSVSKVNSDKSNEVDQILNNLTSMQAGDVDLPQNVDDLMQVFKSMENDRLINPPNDLLSLPAIEKFLTDDVDVMNISMEEPQDFESVTLKEIQSKEEIAELKKRQSKVERRLDFLRRKIYKLQARHMGQHVSGEIAGVYEYVHRSLKRLKESSLQDSSSAPSVMMSTPEDATSSEKAKPISYGSTKSMLKKLEMTTILQANTASRQKPQAKYFGSGSCEPASFKCNVPGIVNIPPWPPEHKQELQKITGLLRTELDVVQHEVDSEATESSSGGESCDEMQNYNNPHQQYLSIQKRALWKYSTSRAAIAARWTWLQAQIADLEYRIRQHTDIHRQIRSSKGAVTLGGSSPPPVVAATSSPITSAVNGYRGQLPGSSPVKSALDDDVLVSNNGTHPDFQCARTRPLVNFRKRRLLTVSGLHVVSKKAARPSTVRCGCVQLSAPCGVCTGRTDPTHPRDPPDALSKAEKIALVDPAFHPVFSLPEDVSCGIHCDAIMKTSEWQQKTARMKSLKVLKGDRPDKALLDHRAKKLEHRKKYGRVLKPSTASALSAKIKNKIRGRKVSRHYSSSYRMNRKRMAPYQPLASESGIDEELESIGNNSHAASNSAIASPSSSPLLHMQAISGYTRRNRANSYDIDNIVIPYSVAASTRVEKLQYKEILTPKWRIADSDLRCDTKNNGAVRNPSQDSDAEDLSEEAVIVRHDKSEHDEKKKFLSYLKLPMSHGRTRSHKRHDSLAESSGANTPDPMSPHPPDPHENTNSPLTSPPATPLPATSLLDDWSGGGPLPSVSAMRRRTISQSRYMRDNKEINATREDNNTPENADDVPPFESRTFPLDDDTYDKMLKNMPENHQFKTNIRAQDSNDSNLGYLDNKVGSPGSESTESALGDEDPNDPEWTDMEKSRDRHKR